MRAGIVLGEHKQTRKHHVDKTRQQTHPTERIASHFLWFTAIWGKTRPQNHNSTSCLHHFHFEGFRNWLLQMTTILPIDPLANPAIPQQLNLAREKHEKGQQGLSNK